MLIRIVKMEFREGEVDRFREIFETSKTRIRNQPGCQHLELLQDTENLNIFFTYSQWKDKKALKAYRHSEFFKEIWPKTKTLFQNKAEAWSVRVVSS